MEYLIDEALLIRYFEKSLSEEERRAVESWINASEENQKMAQRMARIYLASDLLYTSQKTDPQEALSKFWKRQERRKRLQIWKHVSRIAAILILPVILFSIYMTSGHDDEIIPEQFVEVRTQIGITNSIVLPDSSVVYLNSESVLKYPSHFVNNRQVYLQGRAYFIVKKQNGARFVVNTTAGAKVEVLGTEFNVNSEADEVNTTLVNGSVQFTCIDAENKEKNIRIAPGEKISYNVQSKELRQETADIDAEIEWKEGKTVFKDCPFEEALDILSKRFDVQFIVKNEALKENNFTGSFKNQSLEQILDNFALSSNLKYKYIKKREPVGENTEREIIELY